MTRAPVAPVVARRRTRRGLVLLGLLVLGGIGAGAYWRWRAAPSASSRRDWNVLLVTFDTTRADRLSAFGYAHNTTPTLDTLAAHGIRYSRCTTTAPLTLPAHASLLTGLYPFYHGLRNNGVGPLDERFVTLAQALREQGYRTGAVVGAYVLEARFGLNRGFEYYDCDFSAPAGRSKFEYAERDAAAVTERALAWLDTLGGAKFFLWAHYFDPHAPYAPPGFNAAAPVGDPYDLEIAHADRQLDRLIRRIGELRQSTGRPTLIVFLGDHGESLWDHGEPTHGYYAYQPTMHVPLLTFIPDREANGVVIETPVSIVDVYPSVLHWLGCASPHEVHGRVLPLSPAESTADRPIYFESYVPLLDYACSPLEGLIVGAHKYLRTRRPELYRLGADPQESANLAASAPEIVASAERALAELLTAPLDVPAAPTSAVMADEAGLRKLRALGYAGGAEVAPPVATELPDPKDRIQQHRDTVRAQSEIDLGNTATALELVREVLREAPAAPRALLLLTDLCSAPELLEQVAPVVQARLDSGEPLPAPYDALLPSALGLALAKAGRTADAVRLYRAALRASPDGAEPNFNLGTALLAASGDHAEALPFLQRASALAPERSEFGLALAACLEALGRWDEALAVYEQILLHESESAAALNNAAWVCYRSRQRPADALGWSRRAAAKAPEDPRLRHTLAAVLVWQNQPREAAELLEEVLRGAPDYAAAHYHLGLARQALGDGNGAARALRRALELAGEGPTYWRDDALRRLAEVNP